MGFEAKAFLGEESLEAVSTHYDGCESATDLLARVGEGLLSPQTVIAKLRGITPDLPSPDTIKITRSRESKFQLTAQGYEGIVVVRAKCCLPIPGDDVIGYVSRGRGIVLHQVTCPNAQNLTAGEPERMMPYDWPPDGHVYPVVIRIICMNRAGLLADVTNVFGDFKANVSAAKVETRPNSTAEILITLDVENTAQLQQMMTKIGQFSDIISVVRLFGRRSGK
jgi:GTP pyrophosphokinase